jgi:hypothetical protein
MVSVRLLYRTLSSITRDATKSRNWSKTGRLSYGTKYYYSHYCSLAAVSSVPSIFIPSSTSPFFV